MPGTINSIVIVIIKLPGTGGRGWKRFSFYGNENVKLIVPWPVWLSWLEYHLVDQRVVSSIPHQDTYPGFRFNALSGRVQEGSQSMFLSHIDVCLFVCLFLLASVSGSNEKKVLG